MSKPWGGGIGAWAAEAERAEAEEREQAAAAAANSNISGQSQSFPTLKEAVSAKPKKKKMTLSEFYVTPATASRDTSFEYKRLTPDEMLRLPTGPKERSAEEMQSGRLGGGFRLYGQSGPQPGRMRDRDGDSDGSWGGGRRSYGGFDDDRRGPPSRAPDFDQPSRADEDDNWSSTKRSIPSSSIDSGRSNRYGSLGGGAGGGGSKADEVDNWTIGKKPHPVRSNTFGSGFGERAPESDRWVRGRLNEHERERERPRLFLDPPRGEASVNEEVKSNKPNPFGAARPREEVLAEKGLDWKKLESEIEAKKTSRPTSSHSSRPSSAQSSRSEAVFQQGPEGAPRPRLKVNPFGDAKPREVLLEERGKDWRKLDLELEHRGFDRPETDEERNLKEEIDHLKKGLEQGSGGDQADLHEIILDKERDLELLIRELDDKLRFGQKAIERVGSGAGRTSDRPTSSQSESSRSSEFFERPRSHDDRRSFQRGREGGFLGNRDMDRSRSRERW